MKLFFAEFPSEYGRRYYFPYQVWLKQEPSDDVAKIYGAGFLPIRNRPGVYYLARGIRVDLQKFALSSENRRIKRKTVDFTCTLLPLSRFDYGPRVQKLCKSYADNHLGDRVFTTNSIKAIFCSGVYNHVFVFRHQPTNQAVGYAVGWLNEQLLQYAHSFYDLTFFRDNLGAGMMLEAVEWAHRERKQYVYLGTCYGEKARYKTDFAGIEFFTGFRWSDDLAELKYLIERDDKTAAGYRLKDRAYLNRFYQGELDLLKHFGVSCDLKG